MEYTSGKVGRIFVLKFANGDILLDELKKFAAKEKLKSAVAVFLGALRKGTLVTGPRRPVIPPLPNKLHFDDGWETFGVATIFTNPSGPQIHIHSAMGRKRKALAGCVRERSSIFLVIEAVVFELKGVKASKEIDPRTGLNLLRIG